MENFARDLRDKCKETFVEMPFCVGFCMVIKREVIDKIGGLSEEFYPMYFEDTDYSMKAHKAGYLIGMVKGSYVWHIGGTSTKALGQKKEEFFEKNRKLFFKKWGKILRIAWVMNSYQELLDNLERGVGLARKGNFVWFLVRGLKEGRTALFRRKDMSEHAGIKPINFHSVYDLIWKIAIKKKRYDVIISESKFVRWFFSKMGYRVLKLQALLSQVNGVTKEAR